MDNDSEIRAHFDICQLIYFRFRKTDIKNVFLSGGNRQKEKATWQGSFVRVCKSSSRKSALKNLSEKN